MSRTWNVVSSNQQPDFHVMRLRWTGHRPIQPCVQHIGAYQLPIWDGSQGGICLDCLSHGRDPCDHLLWSLKDEQFTTSKQETKHVIESPRSYQVSDIHRHLIYLCTIVLLYVPKDSNVIAAHKVDCHTLQRQAQLVTTNFSITHHISALLEETFLASWGYTSRLMRLHCCNKN